MEGSVPSTNVDAMGLLRFLRSLPQRLNVQILIQFVFSRTFFQSIHGIFHTVYTFAPNPWSGPHAVAY